MVPLFARQKGGVGVAQDSIVWYTFSVVESKDAAPHSKPPLRILSKEELRARFGVKREPTLPVTSGPALTHELGNHGGAAEDETEVLLTDVAQHTYTRVPIRDSPHGLEGWQSYRWTPVGKGRLSSHDVRLIEAFSEHQRTFRPGEPPRWQFFPLDEQRVVFTRVVPRNESDRDGVSFLYLAHSLIVPTNQLGKLPDGVLSLWNDKLYSGDLRQLDEEMDRGLRWLLAARKIRRADVTRAAPPADVFPEELGRMVEGLPVGQLVEELTTRGATDLATLVCAVANAKQLVLEHRAVAICGNRGKGREVERVLRLAFRLAQRMPGVEETALSFTTWVGEGELPRAPFWAVGVRTPLRSGRTIPIDAGAVLESIKALRGDEELPH